MCSVQGLICLGLRCGQIQALNQLMRNFKTLIEFAVRSRASPHSHVGIPNSCIHIVGSGGVKFVLWNDCNVLREVQLLAPVALVRINVVVLKERRLHLRLRFERLPDIVDVSIEFVGPFYVGARETVV